MMTLFTILNFYCKFMLNLVMMLIYREVMLLLFALIQIEC